TGVVVVAEHRSSRALTGAAGAPGGAQVTGRNSAGGAIRPVRVLAAARLAGVVRAWIAVVAVRRCAHSARAGWGAGRAVDGNVSAPARFDTGKVGGAGVAVIAVRRGAGQARIRPRARPRVACLGAVARQTIVTVDQRARADAARSRRRADVIERAGAPVIAGLAVEWRVDTSQRRVAGVRRAVVVVVAVELRTGHAAQRRAARLRETRVPATYDRRARTRVRSVAGVGGSRSRARVPVVARRADRQRGVHAAAGSAVGGEVAGVGTGTGILVVAVG